MGCHKAQLSLLLLAFTSLTCLSSTLPGEFSIVSPTDFTSEDRAADLFEQWKAKHKKVYKHAEEAERGFQNFRNNLGFVVEKNSVKGSEGHEVGLNKFADLSNEEFRRVYLSKVRRSPHKKWKIQRSGEKQGKVKSCTAPSSMDWRKYGVVTGVKDQGSCGSCWAFSSTGAIEGINAITTGELISLSEQELVDCDPTNDGCDGGVMDYAFEWVIGNGGIDSEADYPYLGVDSTCNITKEKTKAVEIDGYEDVDETEDALLCAVVNQPTSVGIDGSALDFQLYTGGIYDGSCSGDPNDIDHAVLVIGYGSEGGKDYWILKNSWGTSWGMGGYVYMRRNTSAPYGVCAINAMASYPTKESSTGPPPPPSIPSPPPPPPPPPSPLPSDCGDFSYCPGKETCCCLVNLLEICVVYGCCEYENAVCCKGTEYCCPHDYPICDVKEGLCYKSSGEELGVAAKKRKMAKHKMPWAAKEEETENSYSPLQWRMNQFAGIR